MNSKMREEKIREKVARTILAVVFMVLSDDVYSKWSWFDNLIFRV